MTRRQLLLTSAAAAVAPKPVSGFDAFLGSLQDASSLTFSVHEPFMSDAEMRAVFSDYAKLSIESVLSRPPRAKQSPR